jgi:hypothetical protein
LGFEATLQEKIAEAFDELFQIDGVGGLANVFSVFDEFHEGLAKSRVGC